MNEPRNWKPLEIVHMMPGVGGRASQIGAAKQNLYLKHRRSQHRGSFGWEDYRNHHHLLHLHQILGFRSILS